MHAITALTAYQGGLQNLIIRIVIGVVLLHVLTLAIALLRRQPKAACVATMDCVIGTACVASVIGSWIAVFFFGRAVYRAATYTYTE